MSSDADRAVTPPVDHAEAERDVRLVRTLPHSLTTMGLDATADAVTRLLAEYDRRGARIAELEPVLEHAGRHLRAGADAVRELEAEVERLTAQRAAVVSVIEELESDADAYGWMDANRAEHGAYRLAARLREALGVKTDG